MVYPSCEVSLCACLGSGPGEPRTFPCLIPCANILVPLSSAYVLSAGATQSRQPALNGLGEVLRNRWRPEYATISYEIDSFVDCDGIPG